MTLEAPEAPTPQNEYQTLVEQLLKMIDARLAYMAVHLEHFNDKDIPLETRVGEIVEAMPDLALGATLQAAGKEARDELIFSGMTAYFEQEYDMVANLRRTVASAKTVESFLYIYLNTLIQDGASVYGNLKAQAGDSDISLKPNMTSAEAYNLFSNIDFFKFVRDTIYSKIAFTEYQLNPFDLLNHSLFECTLISTFPYHKKMEVNRGGIPKGYFKTPSYKTFKGNLPFLDTLDPGILLTYERMREGAELPTPDELVAASKGKCDVPTANQLEDTLQGLLSSVEIDFSCADSHHAQMTVFLMKQLMPILDWNKIHENTFKAIFRLTGEESLGNFAFNSVYQASSVQQQQRQQQQPSAIKPKRRRRGKKPVRSTRGANPYGPKAKPKSSEKAPESPGQEQLLASLASLCVSDDSAAADATPADAAAKSAAEIAASEAKQNGASQASEPPGPLTPTARSATAAAQSAVAADCQSGAAAAAAAAPMPAPLTTRYNSKSGAASSIDIETLRVFADKKHKIKWSQLKSLLVKINSTITRANSGSSHYMVTIQNGSSQEYTFINQRHTRGRVETHLSELAIQCIGGALAEAGIFERYGVESSLIRPSSDRRHGVAARRP